MRIEGRDWGWKVRLLFSQTFIALTHGDGNMKIMCLDWLGVGRPHPAGDPKDPDMISKTQVAPVVFYRRSGRQIRFIYTGQQARLKRTNGEEMVMAT